MTRLVRQVQIKASSDRVWNVLADFGNVAQWAPTVIESHSTTVVHRGVGANRIQTVSSGETIEEIISEWNEGTSFTFEVPKGLANVVQSLRETWSVVSVPGGAIVQVLMQYMMKGGPIGAVLDSLFVRPRLQEMLVLNLAGLKHHVETGETITSKTQLPVRSVV